MRRLTLVLCAVISAVGAVVVPGVATATTSTPYTLAGTGRTGALSSPTGIALDAAGDLFVADTDQCRVVVVPDHTGTLYGMRVSRGRLYAVAGTRCGAKGGIGFPTGVAVDRHGDLFIAEASEDRILLVRPGGVGRPRAPVTEVGTGVPGYSGSGALATQSRLDEPTGVAVDAAGDLLIADTANCRVRMVAMTSGLHYGQSMTEGHLYDLVGDGTCGSLGRPGSADTAQLANPVAVAVDSTGDVLIADNGDQSVVEMAATTGVDFGTPIGADQVATVVGMVGNGNTPYLADGLSATGAAAELNDPEGVAFGSDGILVVTDGSMHCIRVVSNVTSEAFGRMLIAGDLYTLAGALPVTNPMGTGDGTHWVVTQMGDPVGVTTTPSGGVVFSDRSDKLVREIR